MPYNGSGVFTVTNSFTPNTTILSSLVNANFTDMATGLSDALTRSGEAGMTAPLGLADGTAALPGLKWESDPNTGFYRKGADSIGVSLGGTERLEFTRGGLLKGRRAITGADTVALTDHADIIEATSGTFSLAFTAAATLGSGFWCIIYNSGTGTVTLDPDSAEQIDGASTKALGRGTALLVFCTGSAFETAPLGFDAGAIPTFNGLTLTGVATLTPGTSTANADWFFLKPTDFGAGKPYFLIKKNSAADSYNIGLWDGSDDGGTINFAVDALTHLGSNILAESGIADQAAMEAATSTTEPVVPAVQHHHPGHPKAGGNLNGSGTPAFASGDYGMGSVTDNNTGDYTLALDTAFANTNYWATIFGRNDGAQETIVSSDSADTKTASSFQLQAREGSGTNFDSPEIGVAFWGDYA